MNVKTEMDFKTESYFLDMSRPMYSYDTTHVSIEE